MELKKRLMISFIVFILTAIFLTEILQDRIYFSLFVGIPAGVFAGLVVFLYLFLKNRQ
jgi:hypothetical protein